MDKTDKKTKKVDKKTGKKCGMVIAFLIGGAIALLLSGCSTTGAQPSRAQNQHNSFDKCIVVIASNVSVSNETVIAQSGDGFVPSEIFTQTMKNEGSESNAPTATPTNTTDIRPQTDVNTTGGRTAGVLESLIGSFGTWLTTPSGKAAAAEAVTATSACTTGNCTTGNCTSGSCTDGSCSPGGQCSDCTIK